MLDLKSIPKNPGCYLYKNSEGKIIYVGKGKDLRKRVSSYFNKSGHDTKTQCLIENIDSVDYIVTNSEVEALILENTLIKKHKPKYNIHLKYSGNYSYIQLTAEKFPSLRMARNKTDKGKFFGPFISPQARFQIISILNKIFKLKTCKRMPSKLCLRHHIDLCSAPCVNYITKEDYGKNIEKVKMVLNGKTAELLKNMESEMFASSKKLEFEKAIELRNQIKAIRILSEHQTMDRNRVYNEDIINYIVKNDRVYLILFNIYKGMLNNKNEYSFDFNRDFFEEFIARYYSEHEIPSELILPHEISETLVTFLTIKKGSKVKTVIPQKGDKKQLLELVKKNIEMFFFGNIATLEELKKILKLSELPHVVECFDISHLSGTSTVGSMVQFRNTKPDKKNYRRFKIKEVKGIDDVASIAEIVKRRYLRLLKDASPLPNLIIIDGGQGQLNSAENELKRLGVKIPIISIAKRLEEIYMPGLEGTIRLDKKSKALHFIQKTRDEAHRFAITYNRTLRSKKLLD